MDKCRIHVVLLWTAAIYHLAHEAITWLLPSHSAANCGFQILSGACGQLVVIVAVITALFRQVKQGHRGSDNLMRLNVNIIFAPIFLGFLLLNSGVSKRLSS